MKEHDQTISPQLHIHLWEFILHNRLSEVFYHCFKDIIYQIRKISSLCPIFITVSRYLINIHSASTSIFLSDSTEQYVINWNIFLQLRPMCKIKAHRLLQKQQQGFGWNVRSNYFVGNDSLSWHFNNWRSCSSAPS